METDADATGTWLRGHSRRAFKLRLNLIGGLIVLAVAIGWIVAYRTTQRMVESAELVTHTQEVIAAIRGASSELQSAEAAHRDYLLSGETEYRDTFEVELASHHQQVAALRTLTADNERQSDVLDAFEQLVGERIAILQMLAATLEREGSEAAQVQAAQPASQRYSPEINLSLDSLEQEELRLLAARSDQARADARTARIMLVGTGLLTFVVILIGSYFFNRDVGRQADADRRLRLALRAADAANEAKTKFLATVSHEIRTPLNAVSGMSELLLDTRLDSEQAEYARTLHSNAEALAVLIGDLLDSSKIEAGQIELESLPFDLREVVEGVAEILFVRAEIKGVDLVVDVAPELPTHVVGDRNRLRQVVMNLVGNAVKFTEQGEVAVRVNGDIDPGGGSATVRIVVIDTGIGIAPEAQGRIFERFVQGDRTTVRRYGGTGLGLNISRSLVQLMGGTLSVESEPDRGSTFTATLTLPVAAAATAPPAEPELLAGVDVLVADGQATRRDVVERLLRYAGATVRTARTAAEAVDLWSTHPARVVVASETLPDSSGLNLARTLSRGRDDPASPGSASAVVLLCSLRSVLTGYVGSHGISGFVYKPVKQARLLEAVGLAAGRLPSTEEAGAPVEAKDHGSVPPRILLAEDHRDNWILATRILVGAGYAVDLAENGARAIDMASAFRYDLILMDIEMPLVDGIEATRRIRAAAAEAGRPAVPIVALTAHAVEDVRAEALAAGMDDYTTKPIQKQQLLDVCARWIDARPVLLLADDSPENHVLVTNYLGPADYRLISVYNGRDAVEAFTRQRVSLVLLDIDMPLLNGYDAAREIRRARGGDAVPIIALTGYEGSEERQRALAAGFTGYLTKPIHRAELLSTVRGVVTPGAARPDDPRRAGGSGLLSTAADAGSAALQPSPREFANQIRGLLARRDYPALVTLAESLRQAAAANQLTRLATEAAELASAARSEDEQRSTWWGEQLVPTLRDAQRILAVRQSATSSAAGSYDSLAHLATLLLGVPIAAVTLLDEDLLRIKGAAGGLGVLDVTRALPVSHSLCQIVAATGAPLLVDDARADPRVREMPAVRLHGLVSYGGVPLINQEGYALGAFCAIDRQPRRWSPADVAVLEELASVANRMLQMERRLAGVAPARATGNAPSTERVWLTVDDDVADLVPGYVAARRQNVQAIRDLLAREDFDGVVRLGHNMKGSGEGYGLPEVSRVGREIEHAAQSRNADDVRRAVARLEEYLARVSVRAADGRVLMES